MMLADKLAVLHEGYSAQRGLSPYTFLLANFYRIDT
jgi:hypothetical protein